VLCSCSNGCFFVTVALQPLRHLRERFWKGGLHRARRPDQANAVLPRALTSVHAVSGSAPQPSRRRFGSEEGAATHWRGLPVGVLDVPRDVQHSDASARHGWVFRRRDPVTNQKTTQKRRARSGRVICESEGVWNAAHRGEVFVSLARACADFACLSSGCYQTRCAAVYACERLVPSHDEHGCHEDRQLLLRGGAANCRRHISTFLVHLPLQHLPPAHRCALLGQHHAACSGPRGAD
jgi:hypothetical protein